MTQIALPYVFSHVGSSWLFLHFASWAARASTLFVICYAKQKNEIQFISVNEMHFVMLDSAIAKYPHAAHLRWRTKGDGR